MGKRFLIFEKGTKVDSPFADVPQNVIGEAAQLKLDENKSAFLDLNKFGFKKK